MDSPHPLGAEQVRQACIETIFFVDARGYGNFLHATLRKKPALVINAAKVFEKLQSAGRNADSIAR
jgi:hypothetical protein